MIRLFIAAMFWTSLVTVLSVAGCTSLVDDDFICFENAPWPATLDEISEAVQIADSQAQLVLDEFNASEDAERLGGPFSLNQYERRISTSIVRERRQLMVLYILTEPVLFDGHPQHFTVWIDNDDHSARVFGGM